MEGLDLVLVMKYSTLINPIIPDIRDASIKEVMKDGPSAVAVACVHNKKKEKKGRIPEGVLYMSGEDVEDHWNCYPWDADGYGRDIYARMCCQ